MDSKIPSAEEIEYYGFSDDIENSLFYGYAKGSIVGIRYYAGMVNNKEMVSLEREPHNPYDRNAVRVNNVMGQQVGHIKRDMAKALAEVVDQGLAGIEGLVPYGADNVYTIAIWISFWGLPQNKDRVERIMRKHGFGLVTQLPKGKGSGGTKNIYESPTSRAQRLNSDQMKNELNGLFENLRDVDQSAEEEACPAIASVLYKHQRQAVAWMRKRETCDELPPFWKEEKPSAKAAAKAQGRPVYRNTVTNHITLTKPATVTGGILADDMGLGKTLITISLILGNSWDGKPIHKKNDADCKFAEDDGGVVDLIQDEVTDVKEEEIIPESIKCEAEDVPQAIIHKEVEVDDEPAVTNSNRRSGRKTKRPAKYIEEPDDFGDEPDTPKKPKKSRADKGKAAKPVSKSPGITDEDYIPTQEALSKTVDIVTPVRKEKKLTPKLMNFTRESIPSGQPSATLIVCPLSLISNWVGQVEEHVHEGAEVKILVFHGAVKKTVTGKMLAEQDIVITTYQTLALELKRSANTLLFKTKWLRVVLDEGHTIRTLNAQQSVACRTLNAERKWVLSGTPIQNSTNDLHSIVVFLGINYFQEADWWKRTIQRPIQNGDRDALKRIQCLLGVICMRRTKSQKIDGKPIINVPPKDVFVQKIDLDPREREMYDKMNDASKRVLKSYMDGSSQSSQYAEILVYIMRLRQICCHPSLAKNALETLLSGQVISEKAKELATKLLCLIEAGGLDDCCICLDSITSPVITKCSHVFCKACITGVISADGQNYFSPRCPLCRGDLKTGDLVEPPAESEEVDENDTGESRPSSKIHALMHELLRLRKSDPSVKSLVVSQFTGFLRIIQRHLIDNNIPHVVYHGGMARKARENAIRELQSGHAKVMLMTLKSGGVGLNLTAASQMFLMEPSWNPAAEDQCFDRIHRLGQTRPVRITKFVCKNSVEERIIDMQSRKRELAKASLERRDAADRKKQAMDDLRSLMEL